MVQYADGTIRGITWHRYLYKYKYGRLPSNVHIHHKNGNRSDDRLENLKAKFIIDHARDHHKPIITQKYICPWCHENFERADYRIRDNQEKRNSDGPFCSRSCGASWGRAKQLDRL
jgi:hypothetical protein